MRKLKPMQVGEFIGRITTGERDLRYIKLEEGSDLAGHEGFPTLQNYLIEEQDYTKGEDFEENLKKNPINISNSEFRYVKASGIFLPYTIANETHFEGAELDGANFYRSHFDETHFDGAHLDKVTFVEAYLEGAYFDGASLKEIALHSAHSEGAHFDGASLKGTTIFTADFDRTTFYGTDFDRANLYGTSFYKSDLRGVRNLDKARNLVKAGFFRTIVNRREEAIIRNEFKKNNLELQLGQLNVLD